MSNLISRPFTPNAANSCEACCFGAVLHADWCPVGIALEAMAELQELRWLSDMERQIFGSD